ncbi:uncharacterized protein ATNIH1004_004328 [Aspergillus tanneri]|uniref:Uncharacterized protein n=1 Tax=Aspergillus tanneri TaxID=1220188 RepID=A0A5M9MU79_9EURO|nr:uncharacterized protein ATNIH1004_004328 [Aspergillus tanneri]KAA8648443.1 hypothetical protein ATNIH1004_004328 [Aspergillus tanneri]
MTTNCHVQVRRVGQIKRLGVLEKAFHCLWVVINALFAEHAAAPGAPEKLVLQPRRIPAIIVKKRNKVATQDAKAIAVIAGVGHGTGASLARKFTTTYPVALLAHSHPKVACPGSSIGPPSS